MNRGKEIERAALRYLASVGASEVRIDDNGGKHRKLYYSINGHKLFHILPNSGGSGPTDGGAIRLVLADLKRDVRGHSSGVEPDRRVVKTSMVRAGQGNFAIRISISRGAYSTLNPQNHEQILIDWDYIERCIMLTPIGAGGFKPTYISSAGNKPDSLAWVIQTVKVPDWMKRCKVKSVIVTDREIGDGYIRIPISDAFIKQGQPVVESHLRVEPPPSQSDGQTALAMLNEWLEGEQNAGKDFNTETIEINGVKRIQITMMEEL